jgi:hypothetical protein
MGFWYKKLAAAFKSINMAGDFATICIVSWIWAAVEETEYWAGAS